MKPFLQSPDWLAMLEAEESTLVRMGDQLTFDQRRAPYVGMYWYGGYVQSTDVTEVIAKARKAGAVFLRIDPFDTATKDAFVATGLQIRKCAEENPSATLVLDLTQPLDQFFPKMKSKTRYNIRLGERNQLKTVITTKSLDNKTFDAAWHLHHVTLKRHGIRSREKAHFQMMNQRFCKGVAQEEGGVAGVWLLTYYKGDLITANFCIGFDKTLYYLVGASLLAQKKLMGSHFAQWETIKWAKENGYTHYDFWGIAPRVKDSGGKEMSLNDFDQSHRYLKITRFKIGFGGEVVSYPGTYEVVLSPMKYRWYRFLKWVQQCKKRFQ